MRAFSPRAERRLEGFLAQVEQAMSEAGHAPGEIAGVTDDLRDQVWEMAREEGAAPEVSLGQVEGLLPRLGEPASYCAPSGTLHPPPPAAPHPARWLGWLALVATLGSVLISTIVGVVLPAMEELPGSIYILGQLIALVAGGLSWKTLPGRFAVLCAAALLLLVVLLVFVDGGA